MTGTIAPHLDLHLKTSPSLASPVADRGIRIEVATSLCELDQHASAWDRLALSSPERIPMLAHAWVASFLETRSRGRPWICLFAYRGDRLVGVLPLLRTRRRVPAGLLAPADSDSPFAHPLLDPAHARTALRALADAKAQLAPHLWMRFYKVRESSPILPALTVLEQDMRIIRPVTAQAHQCLRLDTTGPFTDYYGSLNRTFRKSRRHARNRAQADYGLEFEYVSGAEAARPHLLETFLRIEASGWKGRGGTAIACDPELVAFYRSLCRRLARRGWLEWHLAKFGGTVVAADLAIRFGRTLVSWRIGYDENFSRYSPGSLLDKEVLVRAFADEGIDELNCLSNPPWMHVWHMSRATYTDLIISPRHHAATLSGALEAAALPKRLAEVAKDPPRICRHVRFVRSRLHASQSGPAEGEIG